MTEETNVTAALEKFSKGELSDVKVLMIEDDVFLMEMVLDKLSSHGCIPYSTPSGDEALLLAAQYQPNVIILDLMLPGISGEEVLARLKADDELKHIPVIVFSNKSSQEDIEANLQAGAEKYLVKSSTDFDVLVEVVKEVAGNAK